MTLEMLWQLYKLNKITMILYWNYINVIAAWLRKPDSLFSWQLVSVSNGMAVDVPPILKLFVEEKHHFMDSRACWCVVEAVVLCAGATAVFEGGRGLQTYQYKAFVASKAIHNGTERPSSIYIWNVASAAAICEQIETMDANQGSAGNADEGRCM